MLITQQLIHNKKRVAAAQFSAKLKEMNNRAQSFLPENVLICISHSKWKEPPDFQTDINYLRALEQNLISMSAKLEERHSFEHHRRLFE